MAISQEKLLTDLIDIVAKEGASDLHLSEGRPPVIRVSGYLIPLVKMMSLTKEDIDGCLATLLSPLSKEEFEKTKETNFAWSTPTGDRFRCNAYLAMGKGNIAMRLVPKEIKSFEQLNLPPILETFAKHQQGFFLVVGPVGSGKSTTLAAMVETINRERLEHVITIEDPIEYIFEPKKALIDQREVKIDTPDFHSALKG
ncbi:MAG: ATPase, T2SS/T4P/T4SS family, partial [Patescibacteria group bacterium]